VTDLLHRLDSDTRQWLRTRWKKCRFVVQVFSMYSDDGRSNLKNSRSSRWAYIPRVRSARKIGTGSRRRDGTGSSRSWNDNKGTACPRGAIMRRTTDLSGAPARCPAKVSHPLRGMALGTLAEIAVRLVISGYIFAVVVYVNASGNWDKDDDLGTWILWHEQSRPTNPVQLARISRCLSFHP